MSKLYCTIANESICWTPSQHISYENSSASFKLGEFINFKKAQICGGDSRSAGLQEYFYLDSGFYPLRCRKTE